MPVVKLIVHFHSYFEKLEINIRTKRVYGFMHVFYWLPQWVLWVLRPLHRLLFTIIDHLVVAALH